MDEETQEETAAEPEREVSAAESASASLQGNLQTELDALVEQEATLQPGDYVRRHMLLSATIRQLGALVIEYQEGTMEERPAPPEEPPPPVPEEPAQPEEPGEEPPA